MARRLAADGAQRHLRRGRWQQVRPEGRAPGDISGCLAICAGERGAVSGDLGADGGECGGGVVKDIKDSQDIVIHRNSEEYPFNLYKLEIQKCLDQYLSIYPEIVRLLAPFSLQENYMIQRYEPNAGYRLLHCERSLPMSSNRVFVFMTYLNTVKNAGTEFPFQNQITECDMGRTVIWPGEWTHPHKGVINKDKVKYIITGWLGFENDN